MSKTILKKELKQLDKEQLEQLILDLYSARKEAKAYLDFFAEPDIDKLTEKYMLVIEKEMTRGKYSKSTARISRVRTHIRDYASYGIPVESVLEMMVNTLKLGLKVEQQKYTSKAFVSGINRLASDILSYGDKHLMFDTAFRLLSEALSGQYGYKGFVNMLRNNLDWSLI